MKTPDPFRPRYTNLVFPIGAQSLPPIEETRCDDIIDEISAAVADDHEFFDPFATLDN